MYRIIEFLYRTSGKLAVGCGDHFIRVSNLLNSQNPFETQIFWQGLKSKVTSVGSRVFSLIPRVMCCTCTCTLYMYVHSACLQLSWHPEKEGLLAYGTDDGRVGVYNLFAKYTNNCLSLAVCSLCLDICFWLSRQPKLSASFHKGTVYRVAWGPAIVSQSSFTQEPFQLYSVGDGVVLQHAPADLDARASDVMSFLRQENLITDVIFSS